MKNIRRRSNGSSKESPQAKILQIQYPGYFSAEKFRGLDSAPSRLRLCSAPGVRTATRLDILFRGAHKICPIGLRFLTHCPPDNAPIDTLHFATCVDGRNRINQTEKPAPETTSFPGRACAFSHKEKIKEWTPLPCRQSHPDFYRLDARGFCLFLRAQ